ncbi:transcriptional antiterminator, BglG family [Marinococcus luteus]|uniref:Transcriptional antiterminator, BglG family n=1 Tax=Marinococcus luteus TaxID=1122204 RepID=A0A1H2T2U1_9BACI|nr:BglG family transcription antiterminator [Marinococcus luteus]SDW37574.1 transcriptional antiterminator, BglG family [Marinococcus luteus]
MEYLTGRERELLLHLLHHQELKPVAEIAEEINVSSRTIHRDLDKLADWLAGEQVELERRTGSGVRLKGAEEDIEEIKLRLQRPAVVEYTPDERRTLLICLILESDGPVKLTALGAELKVTIATISQDLDKLKDWLELFSLTLVRRRGYGVEVQGAETAKRRAMSSLIAENVEEKELLSSIRHHIYERNVQTEQGRVAERLLDMVGENHWSTVEQVLSNMQDQLPQNFADSAYIGLIVHLTLAIERISVGESIDINADYMDNLRDTKEFAIAEAIIRKLERVLELSIPEAEIGYITMHLRGAKLRTPVENQLEVDHLPVALKAKALIHEMEKLMGEPLGKNHSLYEGLVAHLEPALYRLSENMRIHNPLMESIKENYADLFTKLRQATDAVFTESYLPDAEVGFLVLHFGTAIEREEAAAPLHALVVCSSGIGSSKLLESRLRKEVPVLGDLENVSLLDLEEMNMDGYDLIISTIPLDPQPLPHLVVHPFLNEEDTKAVLRAADSIYRQQSRAGVSVKRKEAHETPLNLYEIQLCVDLTVQMYHRFYMRKVAGGQNAEQAVHWIMDEIKKENIVQDAGSVAKEIWEKQAKGFAIPGANVALFHTRSALVNEPSLTLWELEAPQALTAMDGSTTDVDRILLMLAPEQERKEVFELMSTISEEMLMNPERLDVLRSGEENDIQKHIDEVFREWLKRKIN